MSKKRFSEPILSIAMGCIGAVLRYIQLKNGFEENARFAMKGDLWGILLICLFVSAVIVGWILAMKLGKRLAEQPPRARQSSGGILAVAGGICLFLGNVLQMIALAPAGQINKLYFFLVPVLGMGAAVSATVFGANRLLGKPTGGSRKALFLLPLYFCFSLVSLYIQNAENPVLWEFAVTEFALAAGAFGFYYAAACLSGRYRERKFIFFRFLALFFSVVCLGQLVAAEMVVSIGEILLLLFFMTSPYAPLEKK